MIALPSAGVTYATHLFFAAAVAASAYAYRASLASYFQAAWRPDDTSKSSVRDLILIGVAGGAGVTVAAAALGLPLWGSAIFGAITAFFLPRIVRNRRRERFRREFDAALAESLQTVASSLKAGLTLKDSLYVAVENCPAAFAAEVSVALKEYRFGRPIEEALDGVRTRVATPNSSIAFGSMIISSRLGGRLPDMLKQIVRTIRERERVEGRLKALTAQGRAQAFLLCATPPVLFLGMYFYDRSKTAMLTDYWVGQILLAMAIVLEVVGILVTARVLKLEV